jgi:D-alanyl-D-alanine carboxypeptidase
MQRLTPAAESSWSAMQAAAHEDGCELLMVSGFRSIEYQAGLIRNKIASGQTIEDILEVNVAPGFSQHHTGKAIDIATPGFKPLLEEFEKSPAFEWLQQNAGKYGFRMSYPRDNPEGINYEPWHWYRSEQ